MKIRTIAGFAAVALVWGALCLMSWLKPADEFSDAERRKLAQFPDITVNSLSTGSFVEQFESYSLDQFPMRDSFRSLKSAAELFVLRKGDNNGIFLEGDHASKLDYPLDPASIDHAADKLTGLYDMFVAPGGGNAYLAVIPDKSCFLAPMGGRPTVSYEEVSGMLRERMDFAQYIDVEPLLGPEDYFRTDSHWRQECITDVAAAICSAMGVTLPDEYEIAERVPNFAGVYASQSALPIGTDEIIGLGNDIMDGCTVKNFENGRTTGLFDKSKVNARDKYDVYLSGAVPLLSISNPAVTDGKRLVVFRDSFGSSIVPLIAQGYSEVIVVDTRYILPEMIGSYVDLSGCDALFIYSTTIINSSYTLR